MTKRWVSIANNLCVISFCLPLFFDISSFLYFLLDCSLLFTGPTCSSLQIKLDLHEKWSENKCFYESLGITKCYCFWIINFVAQIINFALQFDFLRSELQVCLKVKFTRDHKKSFISYWRKNSETFLSLNSGIV